MLSATISPHRPTATNGPNSNNNSNNNNNNNSDGSSASSHAGGNCETGDRIHGSATAAIHSNSTNHHSTSTTAITSTGTGTATPIGSSGLIYARATHSAMGAGVSSCRKTVLHHHSVQYRLSGHDTLYKGEKKTEAETEEGGYNSSRCYDGSSHDDHHNRNTGQGREDAVVERHEQTQPSLLLPSPLLTQQQYVVVQHGGGVDAAGERGGAHQQQLRSPSSPPPSLYDPKSADRCATTTTIQLSSPQEQQQQQLQLQLQSNAALHRGTGCISVSTTSNRTSGDGPSSIPAVVGSSSSSSSSAQATMAETDMTTRSLQTPPSTADVVLVATPSRSVDLSNSSDSSSDSRNVMVAGTMTTIPTVLVPTIPTTTIPTATPTTDMAGSSSQCVVSPASIINTMSSTTTTDKSTAGVGMHNPDTCIHPVVFASAITAAISTAITPAITNAITAAVYAAAIDSTPVVSVMAEKDEEKEEKAEAGADLHCATMQVVPPASTLTNIESQMDVDIQDMNQSIHYNNDSIPTIPTAIPTAVPTAIPTALNDQGVAVVMSTDPLQLSDLSANTLSIPLLPVTDSTLLYTVDNRKTLHTTSSSATTATGLVDHTSSIATVTTAADNDDVLPESMIALSAEPTDVRHAHVWPSVAPPSSAPVLLVSQSVVSATTDEASVCCPHSSQQQQQIIPRLQQQRLKQQSLQQQQQSPLLLQQQQPAFTDPSVSLPILTSSSRKRKSACPLRSIPQESLTASERLAQGVVKLDVYSLYLSNPRTLLAMGMAHRAHQSSAANATTLTINTNTNTAAAAISSTPLTVSSRRHSVSLASPYSRSSNQQTSLPQQQQQPRRSRPSHSERVAGAPRTCHGGLGRSTSPLTVLPSGVTGVFPYARRGSTGGSRGKSQGSNSQSHSTSNAHLSTSASFPKASNKGSGSSGNGGVRGSFGGIIRSESMGNGRQGGLPGSFGASLLQTSSSSDHTAYSTSSANGYNQPPISKKPRQNRAGAMGSGGGGDPAGIVVDDSVLLKKGMKRIDMAAFTNTSNAPPVFWKKGGLLYIPESTPGFTALTAEEVGICSTLRILPDQYMHIKEVILTQVERRGPFKKRDAKSWFRIDVNKTAIIYDWFRALGWIPPDEEWELRFVSTRQREDRSVSGSNEGFRTFSTSASSKHASAIGGMVGAPSFPVAAATASRGWSNT
ncbi:hypothetical protein BASA81_009452 [Batrachochytrium salamandrivorans]|nr:hypothetical protein BASA81_009452 [Batrachochytrium salamandrivorans]